MYWTFKQMVIWSSLMVAGCAALSGGAYWFMTLTIGR